MRTFGHLFRTVNNSQYFHVLFRIVRICSSPKKESFNVQECGEHRFERCSPMKKTHQETVSRLLMHNKAIAIVHILLCNCRVQLRSAITNQQKFCMIDCFSWICRMIVTISAKYQHQSNQNHQQKERHQGYCRVIPRTISMLCRFYQYKSPPKLFKYLAIQIKPYGIITHQNKHRVLVLGTYSSLNYVALFYCIAITASRTKFTSPPDALWI